MKAEAIINSKIVKLGFVHGHRRKGQVYIVAYCKESMECALNSSYQDVRSQKDSNSTYHRDTFFL